MVQSSQQLHLFLFEYQVLLILHSSQNIYANFLFQLNIHSLFRISFPKFLFKQNKQATNNKSDHKVVKCNKYHWTNRLVSQIRHGLRAIENFHSPNRIKE